MSPRLLHLLSALRAHQTLRNHQDRIDARSAAMRTSIGLPTVAPHRRITLALHRLRDHAARDARVLVGRG
jgi:hypothetical protein